MANAEKWNAGRSRHGLRELSQSFIDALRTMVHDEEKTIHTHFHGESTTGQLDRMHLPNGHVERLVDAKLHQESYKDVKFEKMYLGVVAKRVEDNIDIGFSVHDGTYSVDSALLSLPANGDAAKQVSDFVIGRVREYEARKHYKFMGAGLTAETLDICPYLSSRMWTELDIVAISFSHDAACAHDISASVDADSMARKCLPLFGPNNQPLLSIENLNEVNVDVGGRALLSTEEQYKKSVGDKTWVATMQYARDLQRNEIKIAFFNSTPQGGGVALMRHALVRFARIAGVQLHWYVPKPDPDVFRITKTNHNILQGVADPDERLGDEQAEKIRSWTETNARDFWLGEGGPLRSVKDGGAHIVIVDDPQMPYLCKMAKEADPNRPVVFRSHIQVRADLVDNEPNSPTAKVFDWLWSYTKYADLFVAHPVKAFVPRKVPIEKVVYLPATTDWLDGLNKELSVQDSVSYLSDYNNCCLVARENQIDFPARDYIVQIARFDPAKGIDTLVHAYGELRRIYLVNTPLKDIPQLVIAGHSAIDDPDAAMIFDKTKRLIDDVYPELAKDISVMRLGPVDQLLNVLMSNAKVALQLSTREGFEVKVSEALHKGVPVIATNAGGIPLQVEDKKSGFIVEPNDSHAVAKHLLELLTDQKLWEKMSAYAASHVSDEVGTVGNALSWFYLADTLGKGEKVEGNGRWLNDLARAKAGMAYAEDEPKLPRNLTTGD